MQTTTVNAALKSVVQVAIATALLLLVPLLAMRFTGEVQWTALDFVVAGAMLFAAGLSFVLLAKGTRDISYRVGAAIAVMAALMLVWGNLAVGLIGSENNPANLMYAGVLAIEIIGALVARGRAQGMSRALSATAIAQAVVAAVALADGLGASEPPGRLGIMVLNGFFLALFAASAWLFARAARSNR